MVEGSTSFTGIPPRVITASWISRGPFTVNGRFFTRWQNCCRWTRVTLLMFKSPGIPESSTSTGMSLAGKSSPNPLENCRRLFFSKSRCTRRSKASGSSPGFRSMESRQPWGASAMRLLADSTKGPDTPKWVNIISPSSENTVFPLCFTWSRTFRRERPMAVFGQSSWVSSGTREGLQGIRVCPRLWANAYPEPSEPVVG